nr:immunoglobulin light chain junction region [Macaca mulatta]MOW00765.1 immunoglobulin light chain junction region [Macaca mulatta]MOW02003.1 immunoglobulin light chain junction region [Macaca mulatta]
DYYCQSYDSSLPSHVF